MTLSRPTKIWFDTHYDSQSSGLYCIEQIKERVLDDDNATEVRDWRDADLVHLNTIPFRRRDLGVWWSSKPMVVTQHGGYHWWRSRHELLARPDHRIFALMRAIFRVTSRRPQRIGFSTEYTRKLAVERGGVPAELTQVIPLGRNESYRDREPTATEDPFVLVVVNNRNPRKNVPTIVETMAEMPDVRFVLPGKMWGEYPGELPDNAEVTGYVSEEELIGYYNRAAALYLPTLYEGFGLPFVEAMACGTAVVTTERGSPLEVCGDAAAYVEDPMDAHEHAALLRRLIMDDEYRQELEARGIERAGRFSWQRTADAYLDAYDEVLYGSEGTEREDSAEPLADRSRARSE
ncbi:glycosyltransferase family 4 protein [Natronoarchaeum mannanilyticum]|uniref:Uncharacterized protein n=1 Tax=Natronoarchaeum mannanilyticum TaxID=926360 RepID=A0AAV3T934_9EURY